MPQSGGVSNTVNNLLQRYKERCRAERKRPRPSSEGPPALLPVSFAQAKDWLLKQQKAYSEALQTGAVNEDVREVVADLNRSLAEQPTSTTALLDQPARPASPVVLQPVMSLGPEPVTDRARAEERVEERARQKAEPRAVSDGQKKATPAPKKKKAIPPELEESNSSHAGAGCPSTPGKSFLTWPVIYTDYFHVYAVFYIKIFLCSVSSFTFF